MKSFQWQQYIISITVYLIFYCNLISLVSLYWQDHIMLQLVVLDDPRLPDAILLLADLPDAIFLLADLPNAILLLADLPAAILLFC